MRATARCSERPSLTFVITFAVLAVAAIVPLWSSRFLPMADLPQHLSIVHVQTRLQDPGLAFHHYFAAKPGFTPYVGYYALVRALACVWPLEIANRLVLCACALGLPVAALCLARALERSPWLAMFAFPLVYDFSFSLGFVSYNAGVVVMVFALAAYVAYLRGRARGACWDIVLVLVAMACAATHAMAFGVLLVAIAAFATVLPDHRLAALLRLGPALALFASWLVPSLLCRADARAMGAVPAARPLSEHLPRLSEYLFDWFRDGGGFVIFVGYAAALVITLVIAVRSRPRAGTVTGTAIALLAAGAFVAYLVLPWDMQRVRIVYPRFATLACLFAALAIPLAPGRRACSLIVAVALTWDAYLVLELRRFDATVGDLETFTARMERGTCVAGLDRYADNEVVRGTMAHSHLAEYLSLWTDGLPGYTFAYTPQSPLVLLRADGQRARTAREALLPVVMTGKLETANGRDPLAFYRYFLVPSGAEPSDLFGARADELARIADTAMYALYENPSGTCGAIHR